MALAEPLRWRVAVITLWVLLINAALVATVYIALGLPDQNVTRQEFARLKTQSETAPLEVHFNGMTMTRLRFDDNGTAYRSTDDLPACPEGQTHRNVVYSTSIICTAGG
jgi:hypothetical protein